ncbi:MAG: TetR/AcrR family transcriptional regulator [Geminicoccaceae bacterium]
MPWDKQYDEADVLDRAMATFWARGYEATSISDLVAATGINRGSIYAAFEDKRALFVRALGHYDKQHRLAFLAGIEDNHDPKSAILAVFDSVIASALGGAKPSGCLLVNTALELSEHDLEIARIVRDSLTEVERFFCRMVDTGQTQGQLPDHLNPQQTGAALLALFLGLRVLSRSRPEPDLLAAIAEQARTLLK